MSAKKPAKIHCWVCKEHIANYIGPMGPGDCAQANLWFWLDGTQPDGAQPIPPCPKCGSSLAPTLVHRGRP